MASSEHTLTEFLQHSGRVLPSVAKGEVVLHRRDGEDLVVMTRRQRDALGTTLRALAEVATGGEERAAAVLPWLAFLGADDGAAALREIRDVARVAVATGHLAPLADVLDHWEATGLAAWDEQRLRTRADAAAHLVDNPIPLDRPKP